MLPVKKIGLAMLCIFAISICKASYVLHSAAITGGNGIPSDWQLTSLLGFKFIQFFYPAPVGTLVYATWPVHWLQSTIIIARVYRCVEVMVSLARYQGHAPLRARRLSFTLTQA